MTSNSVATVQTDFFSLYDNPLMITKMFYNARLNILSCNDTRHANAEKGITLAKVKKYDK